MSAVFLKIVNMSIAASWLVLTVLLLRLVLKKAPKWVFVLLWGFVAVRLLCPFSIESVVSLIPSAQTIRPEIMLDRTPEIATGIGSLDTVLNPIITDSFAPEPLASANPLQIWIPVWGNLWVLGILGMLLYTAISYILLRRKVATAVLLRDNIYRSEFVVSPFVLGVFRPRIYLPFEMDGGVLTHVISHEKAHIQRRDHLWKPFGFLILSLHWFNPLIWLGYILLCRDIELACDEKVIREMDSHSKADYTEALVSCSIHRRSIAACPLAFGEVSVKSRVKSVLHYRKPTLWILLAAILICVAVAVCFLTDPATSVDEKLSVFIDCQIADHHQTPNTTGRASCVNWEVLDTKKQRNETTVYMWVLYEEYSLQEGQLHLEKAVHLPTVISAKWDSGSYRLTEYWQPLEGAEQETDIRSKFPSHLQEKALDPQQYLYRQRRENEAMAQKSLQDADSAFPMILYPWVQPYTPGTDGIMGNVETEKYTAISADFAIGADRRGMAVFKDPYRAFSTFSSLYEKGIAAIGGQYDLPPLTATDYALYKTYGWQTESASPEVRDQAHFVTAFLDLYENSFTEEATDPQSEVVEVITGNMRTYYKLRNDTWRTDGRNYRYRLEITGRLHNAAADSTFVYLSNLETISFEQAWKASGLSSNTEDYFKPEEAVLVELDTDNSAYGVIFNDRMTLFAVNSIDQAISAAILMENNEDRFPETPTGLIPVEAHSLIGLESKSGTPLADQQNTMEETTAIVQYVYHRYAYTDGTLEDIAGTGTMAAITFTGNSETGYKLKEFWEPDPGSTYADQIRERFPEDMAQQILDPKHPQWSSEDLEARCLKKAEAYVASLTDNPTSSSAA